MNGEGVSANITNNEISGNAYYVVGIEVGGDKILVDNNNIEIEGNHTIGVGTHTKELSLWPKELGITDDPATFEAYQDWYISSNAGMGVCLTQAAERGAYILSDKATFLTFKSNGGVID